MNFSTDIKYLKGVGSARAEAFQRLSVGTVGALLRFYPRAYEDWSAVYPIREAPFDTNICVKGIVCDTPSKIRIPGGTTLYKTSITDGQGLINLTFFNNKYIPNMLKSGEEYYFFGKITQSKFGGREMASPVFSNASGEAGIKPVYPQTAGLNSKLIAKCVKNALDSIEEIPRACRVR